MKKKLYKARLTIE